jgi:hypothetical protein
VTQRMPWLIAIAGLVLLCAASAVVMCVLAAGEQARAEAYFSSVKPEDSFVSPEEFEVYNDMYIRADQLRTLAVPLETCSIAGAAVLLAVLAQRYDVRHAVVRAQVVDV